MKQNLKENLVVSARGQITLPAAMRRALGLSGNTVVTAEEREGKIVLAPAVVVETQTYSDAEIAAWDKADVFRPGEQTRLKPGLSRGGISCPVYRHFLDANVLSRLPIIRRVRQRSYSKPLRRVLGFL
jgi:antitoxin PrlF